MTAQTYIVILGIAILASIIFGLYISIREDKSSWCTKKVDGNGEKVGYIKLKSCPFCGGKPKLESWEMSPFEKINIENNSGNWYAVFCTDCCSEGSSCTTAIDAINSWNTRIKMQGLKGWMMWHTSSW